MAKKTVRKPTENKPTAEEVKTVEGADLEQNEPAAVKTRHDQVQCPSCGNYGCPANRGTRTEGYKRIQMRTCSLCKLKFDTSTHVDGKLPPQVLPGWK